MRESKYVYLEAPFPYNPFLHCKTPHELDKRVETMAMILMRSHGEFSFEGHPRLQRWLKNFLYVSAVTKTPMKYWQKVFTFNYDKIKGLPPEVGSDMKHLKSMSNYQQDQYTEAAVNRLRSFMSHITKEMFSSNEGVDFAELIRKKKRIILSLRNLSRWQADCVGGLVIEDVIDAIRNTARFDRQDFVLAIDEASRFVGDDLADALKETRKMKGHMWLCFQNPSSMERKKDAR